MALPTDLESQRLANLQEKQKLLAELNLESSHVKRIGAVKSRRTAAAARPPPAKKRRLNDGLAVHQQVPLRTSARISARGISVSYSEEKHFGDVEPERDSFRRQNARQPRRPPAKVEPKGPTNTAPKTLTTGALPTDLPKLIQHYNSWTPAAPEPMLDPQTNTYHFDSHPQFTPNKSPLSILLEGAFGGSYFSPWHSRSLGVTLEDDGLTTLPSSWLSQLQPLDTHITSAAYKPELNKHGVACGQTFAQWEDAGWMNFQHDARGWFEWYIRFWLGRRLDDGEDERQVGRWMRCVGAKGRWKRMLLKKYVEMGVRSVFDDDAAEEEEAQVSPVMHQTCLHWAYQVTQDDLDEVWRERA